MAKSFFPRICEVRFPLIDRWRPLPNGTHERGSRLRRAGSPTCLPAGRPARGGQPSAKGGQALWTPPVEVAGHRYYSTGRAGAPRGKWHSLDWARNVGRSGAHHSSGSNQDVEVLLDSRWAVCFRRCCGARQGAGRVPSRAAPEVPAVGEDAQDGKRLRRRHR